MKNGKIVISGSFNIIGESNKILTNGKFSTTMDDINPVIIPSSYDSLNKGVSGTILYHVNPYRYDIPDEPVRNASIKVYKDGIIYDYTKTDDNGFYVLYLEDGIYDIKIQSPSYNRTIKNQKIINGITPFNMLFKSGQIAKKEFDMVEFFMYEVDGVSTGLRYVHGTLLNENGSPVEDAEIVVANSNTHVIQAFVKTGKDGKYGFVIDLGNLDIIIRSPRFNAKVLRNYEFTAEDGFIPTVIEKSISFDIGGNSLWISY
ncbi:MAG: hypothetical protein K0R18_125 [Bacillales bacterium]|nr:hypothetical protein [Bacillales bacterium]